MIERALYDIFTNIAWHCAGPVNMRLTLSPEAHYVVFNMLLPGTEYTSRIVLPTHSHGEIIIDSEGRKE